MPHDAEATKPAREVVKKQLKKLHDEPINTDGLQDDILLTVTAYLLALKPGKDGLLHWFCSEAEEVGREAAYFLLRLYAYSNEHVTQWRTNFMKVVHGCTACTKTLEEAKLGLRTTYFGAFLPDTSRKFWNAFEGWEVEEIVKTVKGAGISPTSSKSLKDVPIPVLYHLLQKGVAFQNPFILDIIAIHSLPLNISNLPIRPIPPACLLLLLHESAEVRSWVRTHFDVKEEINLTQSHDLVVRAISEKIAKGSSASKNKDPAVLVANAFPFISSQEQFWKELESIIQILPATVLQSSGLSKALIGHLHDTESHFGEVLRRSFQLVRRLGKGMWENESLEFPQVLFDSIKDNPLFTKMVLEINPSQKEKPWFLAGFLDMLASLWDIPSFGEILARLIAFLCDELQHERFKSVRPVVMAVASQILTAVVRRVSKKNSASQSTALANILQVRSRSIVGVACSREYAKPEWEAARKQAQSLLHEILALDVDALGNAVVKLSNMPDTVEVSDLQTYFQPIRKQIWQSVYAEVDSSDAESICILIGLSGRSARLDQLNKRTYAYKLLKYYGSKKDMNGKPREPPKEIQQTLYSVLEDINSSMLAIRDGFQSSIERFANSKTQREIKDFLRTPNMILHVVALLLSPVDDFNAAAQTLIGQAFDIEDRADCFRRLFELSPEATFNAIQTYIEKFNAYALQVREACSVAKALVRCMSDVIEVLGNAPDGLLKNERYIERAKTDTFSLSEEIPKFWKVMTTSISIIYQRTASWSPFYNNEAMLEWMRDALIFGRDILERRRAFEGAALFAAGQGSLTSSPRKLSSVGKRMVNDLQGVLENLQSWLRLVDEELLYQSFALLKSLMECFRDLGVRPADSALAKMRRFVDSTRSNSKTKISFLDHASLAELEVYVSSYDESDDDVVLLTEDVGRKLFEAKKSDAIPMEEEEEEEVSVIEVRKASVSKPPKPSTTKNEKKRRRLSSPEIEEVIITKKPQKPFPSSSKVTKPVFPPAKTRHEPKFEGRTEPRKAPPPSTASSSESDSDEEKMGLADLGRLQDSPLKMVVKPRKVEERRKIKIIDDPNLTAKNPIRERLDRREAAYRNAMRLKPDIGPLHRMILSWDYEHTGDDPPFPGVKPHLQRVPDRFKDHAEYLRVFEPLIQYECWAQIVKSKEETSPEIFPARVISKSFVDDWLDVDFEFTEGVRKDWRLSETDVALLRNVETQKSIMGKSAGFRTTPTGVQVSLRTYTGKYGDPGFVVGSIWQMSLVFSLSTVRREFAALKGLPYYDLADKIFNPRLEDPPYVSSSDVESAMKNHKVNEPQARAILSAMRTEGFSLIQGPPGTGKTSTICGLVGAFLSSRKSAATTVAVGRQNGVPVKTPKEKVLVCAPSNAAIDEVAKRLKEGVYGSYGSRITPKVVRVGAENSINISVKEISLDALVEAKLSSNGASAPQTSAGAEIAKLRAEVQATKSLKEQKQEEMNSIRDNAAKIQALDREIKDLNSKRMNILHKLDRLRDQEKSQGRTLDAARRKARQDVLDDADIICSTLSGAGHEVLDNYEFSMVIIDEAAQSIEISSLIPLKYRCSKCIMVGDPQQLPPTVLSLEASKWGYNQSLFLRLQKSRPSAVHLLSIQYRMHPDISVLPSRVFYNGRLKDGPGMVEKTVQPWHADAKFGVYKFLNVSRGREESSRIGHSLLNKEECRVILSLYDRLRRQFPKINFDYRVGVVSMYRAQVAELRGTFRRKFGDEILTKVDFNTVDGFQGQEKDIIILSCVRAGPAVSSVGFLSDVRRMNVAITRSRSSLFIIGNTATLERSDETWKAIVEDARSRSCLVDLPDVSYFNAPLDTVPANPQPQVQRSNPVNTSMAVDSPRSESLLTPKQMKSAKLPKIVRQFSNGDTSTTSVKDEASKSLKRKNEEEEHAPRPPPAERANGDEAPSVASSSRRPSTSILPPQASPLNSDAKKRRAEKDLRTLEKRKKKANNNPLFIK